MKKRLSGVLLGVSLVSASAAASPVANGEQGLRCAIPADAPFFTRSMKAISPLSRGAAVISREGRALPAVMVDGWHPQPGGLSKVLADLGAEAGFTVTGAEAFGQVSWTGRTASLAEVVDNLTGQTGATWSYDGKVLRVAAAQPAATVYQASIDLPRDRDVTLALLDTLRGLDAKRVVVDGTRISFSGTSTALARIQSSVGGITEIYAFDVSFLEGRPSDGRYAWSRLPQGTASAGAGGHAIVQDGMAATISDFLKASGDLRTDGAQTVAGPSGWALVVPQAQCGEGRSEVTLKPQRVGDGFALQIDGGGFKNTFPMIAMGQTLLVAAPDPVGGWIKLMSIRPRIVAVR